jgi:CheY-like chemotaxis protein
MSDVAPYEGRVALYFEDQPEQVQAIQDWLRVKLGLRLVQATTLAEARSSLSSQKLDLIILDIRIRDDEPGEQGGMQDWTRCGFNFLKDLREGKFGGLTPHSIPVLVITCVVNTADVEEILDAGNTSGGRCLYLAKPVRLDTVERAVRYLMA